MPPTEKRPAADAFLCESCGYDLAGLGEEGACPECGTALAESHPRRRVGTPAQQRPTLASIWRTNVGVLRSRGLWATVSVSRTHRFGTRALFTHNVIAAAVLIGVIITMPGPIAARGATLGYAITFGAMFTVLLGFLSTLEYLGVRYFGRQRRWRVSSAVASVVCAHASVGWIIAAALLGVGWHIGQRLSPAPLFTIPEPTSGGIPVTWPVLLPIAGFFIGLLVFETLVYIGVRRLRFANHAGVVIR